MTEPEQPTYYPSVAAFVENYLIHIYQRQVTDTTDAVWCPEWWKHTEAVIRLETLWRAWEYFRRNPRTGLSNWFLDHADRHMAKLFDPSGPFKYCGVRNGHQELLSPLILTQPPKGMFQNVDTPGTAYQSVVEFVENYLSLLYQRQVSDTTDTVWCPSWWEHTEAVARLDASWRAWEYYRREADTGLSRWFIEHADPHMAVLMDPRGPFRFCGVRQGHKALLGPLPTTVAQPEMFADVDDPERYVPDSDVSDVSEQLRGGD
ncbi:DUF4913 domain-containing protein [Nocardia sp. alder85J]|uniref:DUF4913 domain-containing protein n=1 Tax=Nocardia sp. alder85J TaxID=2862949 RepID=UPI001CD73907|nr:DUF4913 domain-containing protein [Nocardia sp. alder85J]MCX4091163.1 DUF4913 domain-containing protein [Nocardia sp. alder85J]